MSEYPVFDGKLEIRQDGDTPVLTAVFPLNRTATVSNTGRVRKERFASGSMSWQTREFAKLQAEMSQVLARGVDDFMTQRRVAEIEDALEKRNTHLLTGHDYNRAIADTKSGTLTVQHTDEAVFLRAELPPEELQPSWVKDAVLAVRGKQLRGVSPGYQVTPQGRQRLVPEDGAGDSLVREIQDSTVYEYSLVARPSYAGTSIDTRADDVLLLPKRRRYWI